MAETGYTPTLFTPALTWSEPMLIKSNQPLDNRTIVRTKADLVALADVAYGGMLVTVAEENKTYILKPNANNIGKTNLNAWLTVQQSRDEQSGVEAITPLQYVSNMDNWVVASNTSRIVDYLHTDMIDPIMDLNNIYCVIEGGKHPNPPINLTYEGADAGWQAAGLYVVIPDGNNVKLHSLSSSGINEGLQQIIDDLSSTVDDLSSTVDDLSNDVSTISGWIGTPEDGFNSTIFDMLYNLPTAPDALTREDVQTVWNEVFLPKTSETT